MAEIVFPKSAEKYMKLQCNNVVSDYTDCPEVDSLHSFLKDLHPSSVLELGAGLGRVSVFLRNTYDWSKTKFYLVDGNSGDVQIAGIHDCVKRNFYNSIEVSKEFCLANNIDAKNLCFINAEENWSVPKETFDLCYSFKSIGFHWPINFYLDKIHAYMAKESYLFFELRDTRREAYPTDKHWKRRVNFVKKQLANIDQRKYKIVEADTDRKFPVLVLQV